MRKRSITWLIISCLIVLALILASCQAATTEEGQETEVVDSEKPIYGGTLTDLMNVGPRTFDPTEIFYSTGWYMNLVYERLLMADLDTGARGSDEFPFAYWCLFPDNLVTGQLAESWEVVADPLSVVFHLREGVRYQNVAPVNGREFVAQDVVDGWEYQFTHPGYTYGTGLPGWGSVDSVEAIDKYTVVFYLNNWMPNWMWDIGWGLFTIVPKEVVDAGIEDWKNAAGTGPFIMSDFIDDVSCTYEKNPDYWGKVEVPVGSGNMYQIPFVDEFQYVIIKEAAMMMAAFRTGKVGFRWAAGKAIQDEIESTCPDVMKLSYLNSNTDHITLPVLVEPFNDLRVRKALSMAIDRDAYLQANGGGAVLNYPVKQGSAAYTSLEDLPADIRENYEYNPEKAKQLLAEAGYPNGFQTTILIQDPGWEARMSLIAANWADIGVEATLDLQVQPAYNDVMFGGNYLGTVSVGLGGAAIWTNLGTCGNCRLATEEELADEEIRIFDGKWYASSEYNIGFCDQNFIDLYDAASKELDSEKAYAFLKEANVYLMSQVPHVNPGSLYVAQYWWPWIKNYYGENAEGYFARAYVYGTCWIDEDLKEEMGH